MSIAPAAVGLARLLDGRRTDQRAHRRYPIGLEVEYKLLSKGRFERLGSGRTLNVSSGGACFKSNHTLPSKGAIELVMSWPLLLEGVCPLKLIMRGRIVRNDGQRVAIQAKYHEFKTGGARIAQTSADTDSGRSTGP